MCFRSGLFAVPLNGTFLDFQAHLKLVTLGRKQVKDQTLCTNQPLLWRSVCIKVMESLMGDMWNRSLLLSHSFYFPVLNMYALPTPSQYHRHIICSFFSKIPLWWALRFSIVIRSYELIPLASNPGKSMGFLHLSHPHLIFLMTFLSENTWCFLNSSFLYCLDISVIVTTINGCNQYHCTFFCLFVTTQYNVWVWWPNSGPVRL